MKIARTRQNGIAILEAMIAILIFSMGIIALMGMQATTINNVADSKYRNTASFYADQMVGTIWAKRTGSTTANASGVLGATPDTSFACNPCDSSNGNADTQAWVAAMSGVLPSPKANITITNNALIKVQISWTPPNAASHVQVAYTYIN